MIGAVALLLIGVLFVNSPLLLNETAKSDRRVGESLLRVASYSAPEMLNYDELVEVEKYGSPPAALQLKLNTLLNTPFISNEAYLKEGAPKLSRNHQLGQFIRVGLWNIQHGLNLDQIKTALGAPDDFKRLIKFPPDEERYRRATGELDALCSVDILVVNEVDLGLKRTGYRDVARELASTLKMNYVYGVEYIEIDPINLGIEEFKEVTSNEKRSQLQQLIQVDKERLRGLSGMAILSRFPIKRARLIPLRYQAYDWHSRERERISLPETARRGLSEAVFLEKILRQIRYGGRCILIAELAIAQLPEGSITVVATHLENRCKPSKRRRQMQEALSLIKEIRGPLVLAGDFNTSGADITPTTIRRELMKRISSREFWAKQIVKTVASLGLTLDVLLEGVKFTKTLRDPTSKGIFLLAPNREAGMFKDLERMRFADGYSFDFRGDEQRTINGTGGTLANSNQRASKGFAATYAVERTYGPLGKYKLDWILIKAYTTDPRKGQSYRLAPHFAQTLEWFNYSLVERLSDHNPMIVDLPVQEPASWLGDLNGNHSVSFAKK